ncbi:hypothetical protein LTR64_008274 [Lithohypha guttulata]|uniref:uncharacterized protein n=1 Tax=Lithohypha guttulata TaxID=1690604 RepID=UPI002DE018F9|nr:hypothetical protein LTR51_008426 [Lithohypha guttulata]
MIITTRLPEPVVGHQVRVHHLTESSDSLDILQARSGRKNVKEDSGAQRLAIRLGGLPLALASAAAYIRNRNITFQQYLDAYEQRWQIDPGRDVKLPEYKDRTLYTTWNLTYIRLEAEDAEAAQMLKFLAYFDNQEVWYELLHAGLSDASPRWLQKCLYNEISFASVMGRLVDYCLVEVQQATESYTLHNCVHDWTLGQLNRTIDPQSYFHAYDSVTTYYSSLDTAPHAIRLAHPRFLACHELDDFLPERAETVLTNTKWLWYCRHPEAEQMCLRILASFEKALGAEHISTINAVHQLGCVYTSCGELDKAEHAYLRVLEGYKKELGAYHDSTLRVLYTLGETYEARGRLEEAGSVYLQALEGCEKACAMDEIFALETLGALGRLYRGQGRLSEAAKMHADFILHCRLEWLPLFSRDKINEFAEILEEESVSLAEGKQTRAAAFKLARLIQLLAMWRRREDQPQILPQGLMLHLAKALIRVKDDANAQIAIFGALEVEGRIPLAFAGVECDSCDCDITLATGLYMCRLCKGVELCDACMSGYVTTTRTMWYCRGHGFFDAGSRVSAMLESPEVVEGIDVDEWLDKLKKKYCTAEYEFLADQNPFDLETTSTQCSSEDSEFV